MVIPRKPGIALCLRCRRNFRSIDVRTNRICPRCAKEDAKLTAWIPPTCPVHVVERQGV